MDATWQALGEQAGTRGVGVNRVRVAPGKLPTPPHSHGASEELYFVLGGSGLAWQDSEVHEVRPLDCVIQRPRRHEHTFVAGPEGLDFLAFGTRHPIEVGWLPRSRAVRLGRPGSRDATTARGRSRRRSAARVRRAGATSGEHRQRRRGRARAVSRQDHDRAARDPRPVDSRRIALGAACAGPPRVGPALPLGRGGDLRHPRRDRHARALALAAKRGRGE